jgi:hypothetical protein
MEQSKTNHFIWCNNLGRSLKRHNIPRYYYREACAPSTSVERLSALNKREYGVVLRRSLASHTGVPSHELRQLLSPRDNKTWQHLAKNPASPVEVLQQVGMIFPTELWQNPVLPLLLLEQPTLLENLSLYRCLLLAENAPSGFFAAASRHSKASIRWAAAKHPSTPGEVLDDLSIDEDKGVRDAAAKNPSFIPTPTSQWVQRIKEHRALSLEDKERALQGNAYLKTLLAAHPAMAQEDLLHLAKDPSPKVGRAIFTRGDAPNELLTFTGQSPGWLLLLIAAHPRTSVETLRKIYVATPITNEMLHSSLLNALWKNPNTPEDIMRELLNSAYEARLSVNRMLPLEALLRMLQRPNIKTRLEAWRHPAIHNWIGRFLSRIGYNPYEEHLRPVPPITSHEELGMLYLLRESLGRLFSKSPQLSQINYHELSLHTAQRLLHHPSAELRLAAVQEPTIPQKAIDDLYRAGATKNLSGIVVTPPPADEKLLRRLSKGGYFARWLVTQNPATEAKALDRLAYAEPAIAALALCHINTSEETLLRVVQQKNKPRHLAIAGRAKLSEDVLWWLLSSEHYEIRLSAARRPEFKELVKLFRAAGADERLQGLQEVSQECPVEVLEKLAQHGLYGQHLAARHPQTPTSYLTQFAASLQPSLRALAAKNPNTSAKTLALLRKLGASEDLIEIESADACNEAEREQARGLGPFGGLLAQLATE